MGDKPWETMLDLARGASNERLEEYIDSLSTADTAWAIERLQVDERREVLAAMTPAAAADLIEEIPDAQSVEVIESLDVAEAAAILNVLPSADHPALASGPILTTVTDMCGFFLTLSMASLLLERLVG